MHFFGCFISKLDITNIEFVSNFSAIFYVDDAPDAFMLMQNTRSLLFIYSLAYWYTSFKFDWMHRIDLEKWNFNPFIWLILYINNSMCLQYECGAQLTQAIQIYLNIFLHHLNGRSSSVFHFFLPLLLLLLWLLGNWVNEFKSHTVFFRKNLLFSTAQAINTSGRQNLFYSKAKIQVEFNFLFLSTIRMAKIE